MKIVVASRSLKILDFDIENRPLSYLGSDFTTGEITAIAWKVIGSKGNVSVAALGEVSLYEMLATFVAAYNEADIVTGHYIRGHDLPFINGALSEVGLPPLEGKLTSDTKLDMIKRKGISNSQENISAMLGLKQPKTTMSQHEWRMANRLSEAGIAMTKKRVTTDVQQHIEMRAELLKRGWLGPPKLWSGEPSGSMRYQA